MSRDSTVTSIHPSLTSHAPTELGAQELVAYSLPVVAVYFLFGPINILQGIYVKHYGMALSTIASVILLARLFDAVSDPLIGYCADRYYLRYGSRKPFVITGGLLLLISSYFLYVYTVSDELVDGSVQRVSTAYFSGWFFLFYLAYTLFEIPHLAWGGDLAQSGKNKNTLFSLRSGGIFTGSLLFFWVPFLPFFETPEITPQTLQWSVILATCMLVPVLIYCFVTLPNESLSYIKPKQVTTELPRESVLQLCRVMIANKPFLLVIGAFFFSGLGVGMWIALLFIFVNGYLKLGHQFAQMYIISFGLSAVALGGWYTLAKRFDKTRVWTLGICLVVIGIAGTGSLVPGEGSWLGMLIFMTLTYIGLAALNILAPSLFSDISDYGTLKTGRNRGATYFSVYTLVTKANMALGGACGLAIAGVSGFDPTANEQNATALIGLHFAIAWLPALFTGLSIPLVLLISLSTRRQALVQRRLQYKYLIINDKKVNLYGTL